MVVCTANICRSPVGEALLADGLSGTDITVNSAGTRAIVGRAPVPQALDFIETAVGKNALHEGVRLTKDAAEASDLILTMTEEQRKWVTQLAPRTVRRTYTMLEYSRLLDELDDHATYASLSDLVRASAPLRRRANANGTSNDIADPYGGTPEAYATSFDRITTASRGISARIVAHLDTLSGTGNLPGQRPEM